MAAHPSCRATWDSHHETVVWDVFDDDGTRCDKRIASKGDTTDDGGISSDGGAALDDGRLVEAVAFDLAPRIGDVGQDAAGAEEDVIFDYSACVDGYVVLHLDVRADNDVIGDHGVLTKDAVITDGSARANVGEVPNFCSITNSDAVINDGGGMRGVGHTRLGGCLLEDTDDIQTVLPARAGTLACGHTVEEMLELGAEGLSVNWSLEEDLRALVYVGQGAIDRFFDEGDSLSFFVIDEHSFRPDNGQATAIFGPKPRVMQMGFASIGKGHVKVGIIFNH
jgi:hypothetical protein